MSAKIKLASLKKSLRFTATLNSAYVTLITKNPFILFAPHQSLKVPVAEIIFLMKNYCFQKFAALLPFFPI